MKKLLTLALALVMVFAIAAPAMAITDTLVVGTETSYADFIRLDLNLFTAMPAGGYFGGFTLSEYAKNKAFVQSEQFVYGVEVVCPKLGEYQDPNMVEKDYKNLTLEISSDAAVLSAPSKAFSVTSNVRTDYPMAGVFTETAEEDGWEAIADYTNWIDKAATTAFYYFGTGVVVEKGVVKAELKATPTLPLEIYNGRILAYKVTTQGGTYDRTNGFLVHLYNAAGDTELARVAFDTYATGVKKDKVAAILIKSGSADYYQIGYNISYNNGLQTVTAAKALILGNTVYDISVTDPTATGYLANSAKIFGYYETVMKFFGFDAAKDGLLLQKHFKAKSSMLNLKDEYAIQFYTGTIVLPGDVVPPKTGDAASIVGFVMIAVAMIAAGVVVSRKVRA